MFLFTSMLRTSKEKYLFYDGTHNKVVVSFVNFCCKNWPHKTTHLMISFTQPFVIDYEAQGPNYYTQIHRHTHTNVNTCTCKVVHLWLLQIFYCLLQILLSFTNLLWLYTRPRLKEFPVIKLIIPLSYHSMYYTMAMEMYNVLFVTQ